MFLNFEGFAKQEYYIQQEYLKESNQENQGYIDVLTTENFLQINLLMLEATCPAQFIR